MATNVDEGNKKKMDAESKGSVKGNMLYELEYYGLSSKYNNSDSLSEESESMSSDGYFANDEPY